MAIIRPGPAELSTGNGTLSFRLEIDGFDYSFVTDASMAGIVTGGIKNWPAEKGGLMRLVGLQPDTLTPNYDLNYFDRTLNVQGLQFKIVDDSAQFLATQAFVRKPSKIAELQTDLDASATTITVSDTNGWESDNFIYIGSEAIRVGNVEDEQTFTECVRGCFNSDAYAHNIATQFGQGLNPRGYDVPITLTNRKCTVYAYGKADDMQSTGSVIWRGIMNSDYTIDDAGTFQFNADSIEALKETQLGGLQEKYSIRGYYFPTMETFPHEFTIVVIENPDTSLAYRDPVANSLNYLKITGSIVQGGHGFYETKEDFLAYLNSKLTISGWTVTQAQFNIADTGQLCLDFVATGGKNIIFKCPANQGSSILFNPMATEDHSTIDPTIRLDSSPPNPNPVTSTSNGVQYRQVSANQWPTTYSYLENTSHRSSGETNGVTKWYSNTLYVDIPFFPANLNLLSLINKENDKDILTLSSVPQSESLTGSFFNLDFNRTWLGVQESREPCLFDDNYSIELGTRINGNAPCDLGGFLEAIVNLSPTYACEGQIPLISSNDIDIADIKSQLLLFQGGDYFTKRNWDFYSKPKAIKDIVSEECKLLGYVPSFTPQGKITIKKFQPITRGTLNVVSASYGETSANFIPSFTRIEGAVKNVAVLKTSYNPKTDEYDGQDVTVYYRNSIDQLNKKESWTISPVSIPTVDIDDSSFGHFTNEIDMILVRPIILMGIPSIEVSFETSIKLYGLAPGDGLLFTTNVLPNDETSGRGFDSKPFFVTKTDWNLMADKGTISAIAFGDFNGYPPSLLVQSGTFVAATSAPYTQIWTFTVSSSFYSDKRLNSANAGDIDYFRVNDEIEFVQSNNSWTPNRLSGTITVITGQTIKVSLYDGAALASMSGSKFSGSMVKYTDKLISGSSPPVSQFANLQSQQFYAWISSGSSSPSYPAWTDQTSEYGP